MGKQGDGKLLSLQLPFEINQLRYFVASAEQQSFSQAACILNVSQPLISQQIAEMEHRLGKDLFTRGRRNVTLTEAGMALLPEAKAILARLSELSYVVQQAGIGADAVSGVLRIAFEQLIDYTDVAKSVFDFRSEYPLIDVHPSILRMSEILRMLSEQSLEIGMCSFPIGNLPDELDYRVLRKDCLCFVASSRLVNAEETEKIPWLADCLPCCLLERDFRGTNAAVQICMQLDITPRFLLFPDVESILLQMECGTGFTILPRSVVSAFSARAFTFIPLTGYPCAELSMAAVWNKAAAGTAVELFLKKLGETIPLPDNLDAVNTVPQLAKPKKHAVIL